MILDQADIYTNIISPLLELATQEHQTISIKRVIAIVIGKKSSSNMIINLTKPNQNILCFDIFYLLFILFFLTEYLRSLSERQIPAQHFLYEILINLLVRSCQWYQLHQLLQYHIIGKNHASFWHFP